MKPDLYTKIILTVIAIDQLVIAFKPTETAVAQSGKNIIFSAKRHYIIAL